MRIALPVVAFFVALHAQAERPAFRSGEYLVRYAQDSVEEWTDTARAPLGFRPKRRRGHFELLQEEHLAAALPLGQVVTRSPEEVCRQLRQAQPTIEFCAPNYMRYLDRTPDDSSFSQLWSLGAQSTATSIDAVSAWETSTGSPEVVVALLDTGIDLSHPDLVANLWVNPLEIPGNGVDDDHNGYIDDVHGINTVAGTGVPQDFIGHGTHVAGTIGAVGNNGLGVTGVAWNVKLLAVSTFSADDDPSADLFDILSGYDYLLALKQRGVPIIAVNASFGGPQPIELEEQAIARLRDAGVLVVAAAGNDGVNNDLHLHYPASYQLDNLIAVTATDRSGELPSFANYGPQTIHIAAPGVGILSTLPGSDYGVYTGTSMAAPHVTGTLALIASVAPDITPNDLRQRVLQTAIPRSELITQVQGGRFLNADRAVRDATPLPGPLAQFVPAASFDALLRAPRVRSAVQLSNSHPIDLLITRSDFDARPGVASVSLRFRINGLACKNVLRIPTFKNRALLLRGRIKNMHGRNKVRMFAINDAGVSTADQTILFPARGPGYDQSRSYVAARCQELVQSLNVRTIFE